ncbi:ABC transporter substrate-binding protein [Yinghuangia sp. ASG 101]|uniref:ABC transporter substrate-binding protein n=1 Tax=Yinghuangia sp. ASG 101 TaxID=2896848 RepID=UPI001E3FEBA4|nr:ABC transporter substrate-binding protein [Yinghuangia sp. ASG 101]UGQ12397.1 ABC transporter substrate-binding protein [Yinghuangia sp. ASG 101]
MPISVNRRQFLRTTVGGTAALAVGATLTACSDDDTAGTPARDDGARPRGGVLRAAFVGGGASEALDHFRGPTPMDFVRARAWHGGLGNLDPTAPDGVRYGVLENIEVSDDLATYVLRVRPGVRFTDGSPVTARDVLYSLAGPARTSPLPVFKMPAANFALDQARVDGDLTLVLPTVRPIADGRLILCQGTYLVVKDGTTTYGPDTPTCGPFRLTRFEPGQGATFVRNDDYYGLALGGGPYLDGLELRSIPAGDARAGALTGGQVDFAHDLPPVAARTLENNPRVVLTPSDSPYLVGLSFRMNMAVPPFDNPQVREAFKLAVDREAMVRTVLFGRGTVGNDLPALGFPDYARGIAQRPHDPDRARQLLRDAGADGLEVTLTTGPETPGMVEAATLYVEDLKKIGVRASLRELPAGQLFADFPAYTRLPLAAGFNVPVPALSSYQTTTAGGAPSALGWNRPDVDALVTEARAQRDPARAADLGTRAQLALWRDGNTVMPVFKPYLNAASPSVVGVADDLYVQFPGFAQAALR